MKLDGSYGEGGGQILRTAVALSAVTGIPVEIDNIRKNRPRSGISAQHMKAIEGLASICNAEVHGCNLHSTAIDFIPDKIKGGEYRIDIGTAGSIPLILQCLMPAAIYASDDIKLKITGGTDVSWSPSIDYLRNVTLIALSRMGYNCEILLIKRGYYPRGGGCVEAVIRPSKLCAEDFDKIMCDTINGISHSSNLPPHVAERQVSSANRLLKDNGFDADISIETNDCNSTGSGITLWCETAGGIALGKRGLKAETVGENAAKAILPELNGAGVDIYLADQLIPYMALAEGGSFTTRMVTPHTKTNIWVTEQFLDVKFRIDKMENGLFKVWI